MCVNTGIVTDYAWNDTSIDCTGILRSILEIGRDLNFPLDINLNTVPMLILNYTNTTLEYLKLTDYSRNLYSSPL